MSESAAHQAYTMYANAKVANGSANKDIEALYNFTRIEIERLEKIIAVKDGDIFKAEMTIKRLEASLIVPDDTLKRKA